MICQKVCPIYLLLSSSNLRGWPLCSVSNLLTWVNFLFSNNQAMFLQNSEILLVEWKKKAWLISNMSLKRKNLPSKLNKFSFLTFMSVARYSGSDHFLQQFTVGLTRFCFEELYRTHKMCHLPRTLWPPNYFYGTRALLFPNGSVPLTFQKTN